ncbi:ATP-binding protein [Telluribacter sp. SYSU D00476]|uniref:ATP-binding protein n=1 Tax=Telluribacter sp. SYSU D00476 TaxID=2811430 RepID=UPI001FF5B999|nr:ATP-binding protein [Telluribacter sp. SYSU D00476]
MTKNSLRNQEELHFLQGGGEMGNLIRQYDWTTTPLGHPQGWPRSLQTSIGTMLGSPYPMFVWWGREMIMFHNDAYVPVLGKRHPEALGKSGPVVWADVWEFIGPLMYDVLDHGKACYFERQLLTPERKGFREETYFTFSYSPIPDDEAGVGGVFCVCSEDTRQVLSQRRLATLSQLSELTASENTREVFRKSSEILSANLNDMPFGLFYRMTEDGKAATLEGAFGVDSGAPVSPSSIHAESNGLQAWPLFHRNTAPGVPVLINDLGQRFSSLPAGPWEEAPRQAMIIPILKSGQEQLVGFFISGISPRLEFDDDYRSFISLVGGQVSTAIANVSAHEEERIRTEKLIALNKAKTDFFNNVSHEFRTPITLMLGPLEELLNEGENTHTKKDLDRLTTAYQNSLRLYKLVNSLLDFSRVEANRAQASFQPIDLCQYTSELASAFQSAIEKANLTYEIECGPVSEPVYVDPQLWEKIILNLLSNALKFTFEGKIRIELVETETGPRLSVQDTGVGIPQKELPNLFKRFHRIENIRSRSYEGTGIGLALVKELVELHGGRIEVQSTEGKGTTFTINLPKGNGHLDKNKIREKNGSQPSGTTAEAFAQEALLWTANDAGHTAGEGPQTEQQETIIQDDNMVSILLVDDNADMRSYLKRVLGPYWKVTTAKDGLEALELVKQAKPDLVVSDIMMPRMDGFELLTRIRQDHTISHIPVILLSARAGEEATVEGLEKGANDYLVKPFSSRELVARVKTQLDLNSTKALAEKLEKLVEERTQELQRSNQDLEQFAHVVSHDLKEPARKIKIFGGLLTREMGDELPPTAKSYLEKIESSADRLYALIDGVLQYSSAGASELKFDRVSLSEIMESVESDLEIVIQQKGATIHYENLPEINGSQVLFQQLFYNLINNSLKFSRPGIPPFIQITSGMADRAEVIRKGLSVNKTYTRICIQDNGIGFAQTQADKIFKSFTRLNPKDKYEGTGLGLALCKKIAERHGGTIYAEGKEGEGASIILLVPED